MYVYVLLLSLSWLDLSTQTEVPSKFCFILHRLIFEQKQQDLFRTGKLLNFLDSAICPSSVNNKILLKSNKIIFE